MRSLSGKESDGYDDVYGREYLSLGGLGDFREYKCGGGEGTISRGL